MPTRLAIIADVHIEAPADAAGVADATGSAARGGRRAELLSEAVRRIVAMKCDSVVLLGDTVEFGLPHEYAAVRSILAPVLEITRPMVGNHELQRGTIADFRRAWHCEPATADLIENMPTMRFNSAIAAQPEDEFFGAIDREQIRLCDAVLAARPALPALIFSHHPLPGTVRRSDEPNYAVRDASELRSLLDRHGAPIILFSGHTHAQSVFLESANIQDAPMAARRSFPFHCIGCPPLGYWPHAFVVVDISPRGIEFQTHQLIDSPSDSPSDAPSDSPDPEAINPDHRRMQEGESGDRAGTISFDS